MSPGEKLCPWHDKKSSQSYLVEATVDLLWDCPLQLSRPFHCFGSAATTPTEAFGRHGAGCDCNVLHFQYTFCKSP